MFKFEQLFRYGKIVASHHDSPLLVERERFLHRCAEQGMAKSSLTSLATELLVVVRQLELGAQQNVVTVRQIDTAAERWARHQRRCGRSRGLHWSHERFSQVATAWLRFMDRLESTEPKHVPGAKWIEPFIAYCLDERGLSVHTVRFHSHHMGKFFEWFATTNRTLIKCRLKDVDAFLESLKQRGWCRVSIARSVETLRAFFRYAERRGWCTAGIAIGIERPRLYRDEGLPVGPDWSDVERLIQHCEGSRAQDIRDKAILELLAIYGLRTGEVTRLRLEDLNWSQDRIRVTRPKQRCSQEYPLLPCVGESVLHYLQEARPRCAYREVFLTSKAPIRPISASAISTMVSERFRALGIRSLRSGAHALRHACAGRLIAQGLSLKEIGDHLGHRSAYSTRTYAKVDLAGLREVAELSLGGLL
jgi:site-specific recombinase XerD